jgi:hypothetical protein
MRFDLIETALQYNKNKKGMNCDFCLNAIPKLPLTCAKMNEPSINMKIPILKNPFHLDQWTIKYLITIIAMNKHIAFSKDAINPSIPNPSKNKGRNQKVNNL